jgi:DNA-binding GntR family transcriptional regulator
MASNNHDPFSTLAPSYLSKSEMVSATLRELIVTGALPAGSRLPQRDIAERFAVSATPVREALRRLEAQGLVVTDPHKGSTVVEADFGPTKENYRIRAALEGEITAMAAERASDDDLAEISSLADRFARARKSDPDYSHLNTQFHFRIYEAARSALAMSLLRLLWQAFPYGPQTTRPRSQSVKQHAELMECLRDHDAQRAAQRMREHILGALPYLPDAARSRKVGSRSVLRRASG